MPTGTIVALREDVGRHNALDKLIGHALMRGECRSQRHGVIVSGRASFELMQKAKMAGCPARGCRRGAVVAGRRARARVRHHAGRLFEVRPLQRLQPARPHRLDRAKHGAALARLLRVRRGRYCRSRMRWPRSSRASAPSTKWKPSRSPTRTAACSPHDLSRRCSCRRSRTPPSTATPCAGEDVPSGEARLFRVAGRLQAGSAAAGAARCAGRSDSHLHRRADARRCGHGVHAGGRPRGRSGRGLVAGGPEERRERAAGRRGHRARARDRAGRVAGCARRTSRVRGGDGPHRDPGAQAREGCGVLQRRRDRRARHARGEGRKLFDSNRFMLIAMLRRIGCAVTRPRHSPRRQRRDRAGAESRRALARSDLELGRRLHRRGRLRQGRGRERRDAWCSGASR